ncbi:MAG: hypothetical protein Kow0079_08510 [Vicingaceae bacterium]
MKKIISILLALILLISTIGININQHYCGNHLVKSSIEILPNNLSCGMADDFACETSQNAYSKKCCDNEHQLVQIADQFTNISKVIDLSAANFIFIISYFKVLLNELLPIQVNQNNFYSPPLLLKETAILFQVFRL